MKENPLIEVNTALDVILRESADFGTEEVSLKDALGRVLKENIRADRDLPPFDRVVRSADGVSIHVIYIDYLARLKGGKLKAGSDVGEAMWVEKEHLAEIWEELHDDTKKLLRLANIKE